jgi:hypothetical protein
MDLDTFIDYHYEKSYWFEEPPVIDLYDDEVTDFILLYKPYNESIDYEVQFGNSKNEIMELNYENCEFEEIDTTDYTYHELLNTYDWSLRRLEIILRDSRQCTNCSSFQNLEVHHKVYVENIVPWNYHKDDLITLCRDCHQAIHDQENIPRITTEDYKIGLLGGPKTWRKVSIVKPIELPFSLSNINKNEEFIVKKVVDEDSFSSGCLFNIFWVLIMVALVYLFTNL